MTLSPEEIAPNLPISMCRVGGRPAAIHSCDHIADLGNVAGLEVARANFGRPNIFIRSGVLHRQGDADVSRSPSPGACLPTAGAFHRSTFGSVQGPLAHCTRRAAYAFLYPHHVPGAGLCPPRTQFRLTRLSKGCIYHQPKCQRVVALLSNPQPSLRYDGVAHEGIQ